MCTYNDRGDADSGQHLLDQSVAIVQGLHHHALLSGHLRRKGFRGSGVSSGSNAAELMQSVLAAHRSTVETLVVQQVLLEDRLLARQLLLGHLLHIQKYITAQYTGQTLTLCT